jgi:hypothetical protein
LIEETVCYVNVSISLFATFTVSALQRPVWLDEFVKKNHPNYSPTHFLSKLTYTVYRQKGYKIFWLFLQFSKKIPKGNNRPKSQKFAQSGHPGNDTLQAAVS